MKTIQYWEHILQEVFYLTIHANIIKNGQVSLKDMNNWRTWKTIENNKEVPYYACLKHYLTQAFADFELVSLFGVICQYLSTNRTNQRRCEELIKDYFLTFLHFENSYPQLGVSFILNGHIWTTPQVMMSYYFLLMSACSV